MDTGEEIERGRGRGSGEERRINMASEKPFDAMNDVGLARLDVLMRGWKEHWEEYVVS